MRTLFLISGLGMIIVAFFSFFIWNKKRKADLSFYLLGASCWVVAVVCKFAIAALFNEKIRVIFEKIFPEIAAKVFYYVYIGLLTGIFECGMVLLFLYLIKSLQNQSFEESVAFGIGFGAIEALLLGIISIISVSTIIIFPQNMPQEVLNKIDPSNLWIIPAPIIERISAIFIHVFSTVLIVYAFITRKFRWFWASFLYKTFVDTLAAWFALNKYGNTPTELYSLEFEFFILAVFGFLGLKILKEKWPSNYEGNMS